ncbi:MAG: cupin [Corynebacterium sp.]|uniref:cupin n=1 Tax=Corynebacterium sp. TaxID=1720 RepID=UPI0026DBF427|nr:cupin [Corynebacterium sp.]MDO5030637.1 cupin [Corynebacterium sp.]
MKIFSQKDELLTQAKASSNGRAAEIAVHDGPLRQTLIALTEGTELSAHNSPPAASMFVLAGEVRITGADETTISEGNLKVLTHVKHGVKALADSVFLLTTVTGVEGIDSHGDR